MPFSNKHLQRAHKHTNLVRSGRMIAAPVFLACLLSLLFVPPAAANNDAMPQVLRADPAPLHLCSNACTHKPAAPRAKRAADQLLGGDPQSPRGYDVIRYHMALDWVDVFQATVIDAAARQFSATVYIDMQLSAELPAEIVLDAHPNLRIKTVTYEQTALVFQHRGDLSLLCIPTAGSGMTAGSEIRLQIDYQSMFEENEVGGFLTYDQGFTTLERIAYTLSAPNYAHHWFPCNDDPADKVFASYDVIVPAGITVACNGRLGAISGVGGRPGLREYRWDMLSRTSTYLMAVHASTYAVHDTTASHPDIGPDPIPLEYYYWAEDWNSEPYSVSRTLGRTPEMMQLFAGQFGEYPFKSYGMAIAEPFTYGAMENQQMVTLGRQVLRGDLGTVAHELLHMWMGDHVTPATWSDIWFNEGAATYGEALWAEYAEGFEAYRTVMNEKRGFYLRQNTDGRSQPALFREIDPDDRDDIYNYAITYSKGSWIYHMLRGVLGDETFFLAMRNITADYGDDNITTEQFIESVISTAGAAEIDTDLGVFFDQWIFSKGHPIYAAGADLVPGGSDGQTRLRVLVRQTQVGVDIPEVFQMPVTVEFRSGSQVERRTFLNNQREQTEFFDLPFTPDQMAFDPDDAILCVKPDPRVVTDVPADADQQNGRGHLEVTPSPLREGDVMQLGVQMAAGSPLSVRIYDQLGGLMHQQELGVSNAAQDYFAMPVPSCAPGLYVMAVSAPNGMELRQSILIGK